MFGPLDLCTKLQAIVEADESQQTDSGARIVDPNDLTDSRLALNICIGPCIGWDDYVNKKPYKAPHIVNKPGSPIGPADGTGWTSDNKGRPIKVENNPDAVNHGGVRPWSPEEVMANLMDDTEVDVPSSMKVYFPRGLMSMVRSPKNVASFRAANPGRKFVPEDHMDDAIDAAYQAILRDEGRDGTEFTKYLATNMDLIGGPSAGVRGEHRKISSILLKLSPIVSKAANAVKTGKYDPEQIMADVDSAGSSIKMSEVDPSLPPTNEKYTGKWGPELLKIRQNIVDLLKANDAKGLQQLVQVIDDTNQNVQDEDDMYHGVGMGTGRLGRQPKDLPAIGSMQHRYTDPTFDVYFAVPERLIGLQAIKTDEQVKKLKELIASGKNIMGLMIGEDGKPIMQHFEKLRSGTEFRAQSTARDHYAKEHKLLPAVVAEIPIKVVQQTDTGAGARGIGSLTMPSKTGGEIENPRLPSVQSAVSKSEELKQEVTELLTAMRYGSAKTKTGQARRASDIIDQLSMIIKEILAPVKRKKFDAVPDERIMSKPDSKGHAVRAGGYNIVNTDNGQVVGRAESESEAADLLEKYNDPLMTSMKYISKNLTLARLGEHYQDLLSTAKQVFMLAKTKDDAEATNLIDDLQFLKSETENEIKTGAKDAPPMLRDIEYRIALRKLGISNYPERGTINDPEIDEDGNLSLWAQAGYPMIYKDVAGKGKGSMSGTLYQPGQEDGGEALVDKHIKQDLGVSAQSVGNIWKKVQAKLTTFGRQVYEHYVWSGEKDHYDLQLLSEAIKTLHNILIEDLRRTAGLIFG